MDQRILEYFRKPFMTHVNKVMSHFLLLERSLPVDSPRRIARTSRARTNKVSPFMMDWARANSPLLTAPMSELMFRWTHYEVSMFNLLRWNEVHLAYCVPEGIPTNFDQAMQHIVVKENEVEKESRTIVYGPEPIQITMELATTAPRDTPYVSLVFDLPMHLHMDKYSEPLSYKKIDPEKVWMHDLWKAGFDPYEYSNFIYHLTDFLTALGEVHFDKDRMSKGLLKAYSNFLEIMELVKT